MKKTKLSPLSKIYMALILIFLYAPIAVMAVFSFNNSAGTYIFTGFSTKWWNEMFNNAAAMSALKNTLMLAVCTAIVATVIGTMAAVGIYNYRNGMNTDYYMDLNPYVEKDGVNLDDVLVPGIIDGYYDTDGKLEGFPLHANIFVMAFNKDMFDQAGVPYPEEGWTFQDLNDWGTKFVSGEGANKTYGMVKHWVMNNLMLYAAGGTPYTDDLTTSNMGSSQIVDSLTLYKELMDKGIIPDSTAQDTIPAETLFVSGKAAMYPCGGFEAITVTNDSDENGINLGFAPMPSDPDGNEINVQYATGWAITKTSKNPDAAWQFLKESAYANEGMLKENAVVGMPAGKESACHSTRSGINGMARRSGR